jgi:phosphatidylserine/phosphatidylglycerophosphate/cardiolipin synthase-like enzyme
MYDFVRASVRDALVAAQGRGVNVRIVADTDAVEDPIDGPFYSSLMSAGIPVISDTLSSLQHNKFAIFDSTVTWTGSANWSDNDLTRNGNNVLAITDTIVASIYTTEFEEMFGEVFSNSKADNTAHSALVDGSHVEIAFSPTDSIESRIISALGTADATIQVAMFTFTNDAIGDALIAARRRGVQVEVLLDGLAAGGLGGERDQLCAAGITVRVENWSGLLHNKYVSSFITS